MRYQSTKARRRAAEAKPVRDGLIREVKVCECCGHYPEYGTPGTIRWSLCCHEILNGPLRQKCLDKVHSLLCVCWYCNSERLTDKKAWPEARQLALLKASRPHHYDLEAHNLLANERAPNRITEADVAKFSSPGGSLPDSSHREAGRRVSTKGQDE